MLSKTYKDMYEFDPGFDIKPVSQPLGFTYGNDCFGPLVETRKLDDIRKSLLDPDCDGPEIVYAIAMDVGKIEHKPILHKKMLLFGAVTYAAGKLGNEPVRSQGHIHKKSSHSGWSPPEIYEIWNGSAIIYMQEYVKDDPGRCFAVYAKAGDVVVVPPEWAHATISADPCTPLTFGAWCDREYGFLYDEVRAKKGLAWYPLVNPENEIYWIPNPNYQASQLIEKQPADYSSTLHIDMAKTIYNQFEQHPDRFQFVSKPSLKKDVWLDFTP
jgi:glucose-6-phosphate isomerase